MFQEVISLTQITLALLLEGSYDYLIWGYINNDDDTPATWKKVYRVIKEIVDLVIIPLGLLICLHLLWYDLAWFFLLKAAHTCDRWYNKISKWRGRIPSFWGYWRWWVMYYGWKRTKWFKSINAVSPGFTFHDYVWGTGHFKDDIYREDIGQLPKYGERYDFDDWQWRRGMSIS